jgi:uncharacterized damage-inducible protein DinB
MISREYCLAMATYNAWMNDRLYTAAAPLTDEARKRDLGAFFGSLHATLNHLLVGDSLWLSRFSPSAVLPVPASEIRALDQILFDDFHGLRTARQTLDTAATQWAQRLPDPPLPPTLRYRRMNGEDMTVAFAVAVIHFFNHQTHHRGQATTLLKQLGVDPGVTDFIMMPGLLDQR